MKKTLMLIVNCLRWFESLDDKGGCGRLIQILIALCGFILLIIILPNVSGLMVLFFPRISTFLILTCIAVAFCIVVLTPFLLITDGIILKKISEEVWLTGLISSIFLTVFAIGLFMFAGVAQDTLLVPMPTRRFFSERQFPLGNLGGITVDSKNRIYLTVETYDRVQVYSSQGDFLKGWFVNTQGGTLDIWIEGDNFVHVRSRRANIHQGFDLNGQLLERERISSREEYESLSQSLDGLRTQDVFGNTYLIQSPKWFPRVIKISPGGHKSVLIKDPFHLWLLRSPQPVLLLGLVGLIMSLILGSIVRKKVDFSSLVGVVAGGRNEETHSKYAAGARIKQIPSRRQQQRPVL